MNDPRIDTSHQNDRAGGLTRERLLVLVLAAATALAFWVCYLLVQPFVPVLAWTLALAIVAHPLHDAIASRVRNPDVAAALAVGLVALLILLPVLFVLQSLVSEAAAAAEWVRVEARNGRWLEAVEATPWLGPAVGWLRKNVDVGGALQQVAASLTGNVSQAVTGSLWATVQLLLVLYALFFFFRDREQALGALRALMPLSDAETDEVFKQVADTIYATVYGSLFVALIQGVMGGLMFWLLGLPSPVLWGVVMALLAVVPNLGTFVVWGPAAIFLALHGDWGRALILAAWGAVAIGLIDNLLYPYLVGHRMRLHTLPVFYAIFGGLLLLGPSGVVLGPVILAVTLALVDVWRRRTAGGRPAEAAVQPMQRADFANRELD
jgi:predicted PurR-regulated permease PerM